MPGDKRKNNLGETGSYHWVISEPVKAPDTHRASEKVATTVATFLNDASRATIFFK